MMNAMMRRKLNKDDKKNTNHSQSKIHLILVIGEFYGKTLIQSQFRFELTK